MKIPVLPSRFENFNISKGSSYSQSELERLKSFIFPVEESNKYIERIIRTMKASNSGAFIILVGKSGIGKTTFLNTLPLYIQNIQVKSIYNKRPLDEEINKMEDTNNPRIIVLENRETVETLATHQLEQELHLINRFIRSDKGRNTIVVWPCNGEEMANEIVDFARHIGGSSLIGKDTVLKYNGPSRDNFIPILKKTYEFFNECDISDMGFTDEYLEDILNNMSPNSTIGDFLEEVRNQLLDDYNKIKDSKDYVGDLFDLIICVVAGNNPITEVEYLTKGDYSNVDFDRLLSATDSNIKSMIARHRRIYSMVATQLNFKIVSIDWQEILEILEILRIKSECDDITIEKFDKYIQEECGLKLSKSARQLEILKTMNLTRCIEGLPYKRKKDTLKYNSQDAFNKILALSKTNDTLIHRKICRLLKENNIINVGEVEESFGYYGYEVISDMICSIPRKYIRIEFMWRETASAADISRYSLEKLYEYCKAMRVI